MRVSRLRGRGLGFRFKVYKDFWLKVDPAPPKHYPKPLNPEPNPPKALNPKAKALITYGASGLEFGV